MYIYKKLKKRKLLSNLIVIFNISVHYYKSSLTILRENSCFNKPSLLQTARVGVNKIV